MISDGIHIFRNFIPPEDQKFEIKNLLKKLFFFKLTKHFKFSKKSRLEISKNNTNFSIITYCFFCTE